MGAQYNGQFLNNSFIGGLPNSNGTLPANVKPVGDLYFDGYSIEMLCFLTNGDHRGINKMDPMYSQVIPVKNFSFGHGRGEEGSGATMI